MTPPNEYQQTQAMHYDWHTTNVSTSGLPTHKALKSYRVIGQQLLEFEKACIHRNNRRTFQLRFAFPKQDKKFAMAHKNTLKNSRNTKIPY